LFSWDTVGRLHQKNDINQSSAKQNNLFCFFLETKTARRLEALKSVRCFSRAFGRMNNPGWDNIYLDSNFHEVDHGMADPIELTGGVKKVGGEG
jgi:hypothetical protein